MATTVEKNKPTVFAIETGEYTTINHEVTHYAYEHEEHTLEIHNPAKIKEFTDTTIETMLNKARGEGQAEAWELARKIVNCAYAGGYSGEELHDIFGHYTAYEVLYANTSFAEAQAKVIAFEEAFHVGDIVVNKFGSRAVVTCAHCGTLYVMYKDGSGSKQDKQIWCGKPVDLGWKKTGEHIKLDDIFKAIDGKE